MENTFERISRKARKKPLLCREEEQELLEKYQKSGDHQAFERLVESHMNLVIAIAKKYTGYGLDITDMIQEGSLGLMNAINKYDQDKKARLSTYASWHIKASIMDFIFKNRSIVKTPQSKIQKKLFYKKNKYLSSKMSSRFDEKTIEDILQCECSPEIERICVSLTTHDKYFSGDNRINSESNLPDPCPNPEERLIAKDNHERIKCIVNTTNTLSSRQREAILHKYFNKDHVVMETRKMAEKMGFTCSRGYFIKNKAYANLQRDEKLQEIAI